MASGRTRSPIGLGARKEKAAALFGRGFNNAEVARELQVGPATVARYRAAYDQAITDQARANPQMLRDVLNNTQRALIEVEQLRAQAWQQYEATNDAGEKARFLGLGLKALDQKAKLYGLFGVKQEVMALLAATREQQSLLMQFMASELCVADRRKLQNYIVEQFADELGQLPTAEAAAISA